MSQVVGNKSDTDSISSERSGNEDEYWIKVMNACYQDNLIPFGLQYPSWEYHDLEPIDCGTYSQVIKGYDTKLNQIVVFKVINVVSIQTVKRLFGISLSRTELLGDALNEILLSRALSNLHTTTCDYCGHEYQTHTYPKMFSASLVHGSIPNYFLFKPTDDETDKLESIQTFRESPNSPRQYLVLVMKYCGDSLWRTIRNKNVSAYQLISICFQLLSALAVAECVYEFEHRDLHMSNVLLKKTKKTFIYFTINTVRYRVRSYGIKAYIIDTTFSRIKIGDNVYFTSLSNRLNPKLSVENPDLQDFTYQQMVQKASNDWEKWIPETNIFWLKYLFKSVNSCEIVKKCEDKMPSLILKQLLEQICKYEKLEDFVSQPYASK